MGRLDSTGWKVLGQKGFFCKKQTFQCIGYPVHLQKAMVDRLKMTYHTDWFKEDGASFPVRIFLLKDEVTVALDTTGDPLHKRGYRTWTSKAPISETLAAALIMLTPWRADRILVDPFCGSGTFLIEAAMMAANIAPGMNRSFTAEAWTHLIPKQMWYDVVEEAEEMVDTDISCDLQGYDIDPDMIRIARANAKQAGVDHLIHFQQRDVADLKHSKNTALSLPIRRMENAWRTRRIFRHSIRRSDRSIVIWMHGQCI